MSVIVSILREVCDPRQPNARHCLTDILFVALVATLCGSKNCVEVAEFTDDRLEDLREFVPLRHGAPSHDTFSRVFRLLDPAQLEAALTNFIAALRRELGLPGERTVVAIDGKALRRGYDAGKAHLPPMMVSVWDTQTRLALATTLAPGGSETKATIALLSSLTLKGCIVTADALHCNPAMAEAVRSAKADYAITLKANHGPLFAAAVAGFANRATAEKAAFHETTEHRHGREEWRRAATLPASAFAALPDFPSLKAIARLDARRTTANGKISTSTRYVVLSRQISPQQVADVVRSHWDIENGLHWTLDVVFDEDDARTRKNYAPQNIAVIRRLAQNILRAHPLQKPLASKMRRAKWKKTFLFELFAHMR